MESVHIKFSDNGIPDRRFTLKFVRGKDDVYKLLVAKLLEYGYSTTGKTFVWNEGSGSSTIVDSCEAMLEAMDACCGYPLKLEFLNADNSYLLSNETCKENSVLIRFKGGELCRRFSLKLERNAKREAFETLVSKLRRYGYEANGRTLVAIECDGTRTVIDDSESLWNVLEGCGFITATNASLELEYFKSEDLNDFDYSKEKIYPESGAGGRKSQATLIGSQISSTRSDAISSDSESFSRISRPDSALEQTVFDNDIALQQIEVDGATLDRCGKIEKRLEKLEKKVDELAAKMARLCHQ